MELKKQLVFASIIFVVSLLIGAGFFVWQNSREDENMSFVTSSSPSASQGGSVAVLTQTGSPVQPEEVAGMATEPQPVPEPTQPELSTVPYSLDLPDGWEQVDSKTEADPCTEGHELKVDTYQNGAETLVVYENGHPDGCARTSIADVYLDYDFTEDGSGIEIDTRAIDQCSKDENPACPRGDGRVSVYIGNESTEDPTKLRENLKTGKTYFFSLTDTSIDPSFEEQVRDLAQLVQGVTF